ncbi:MAG: heavy metal-associated domain-containing protein [Flavobacteriales bacterium]
MATLFLHVDNLKCGGCANTVRHRVQELPGARSVIVDPGAGTVQLEHDGSIDPNEVKTVLHKLGYPQHGSGGIKEAAISYISCAMGRFQGED